MDLNPKTIVYTPEGSGKLWLILDQKCRYDSRSWVFHENAFTPQLSARDSIGGSVNPMTWPFWGYFAYPPCSEKPHTLWESNMAMEKFPVKAAENITPGGFSRHHDFQPEGNPIPRPIRN